MNNLEQIRQGTYLIRVPANLAWNPIIAEQLMISFFAIPEPIRLAISATDHAIYWLTAIPQKFEQSVFNSIYSRYPRAEVTRVITPSRPEQFRTYHFETAAPFVRPLKYVRDFPSIDALAPVVAALGNLNSGEEVVYDLSLNPAEEKIFKLGWDLVTRPRNQWWHVLTLDGAFDTLFDKVSGTSRINRFVPELQKLAQGKLATMLKEATLTIKVKASSATRANEIAGGLIPALAPLGREGSNYLIPANKESFPLILMPQEAAALWHLPSEFCRDRHITWSSNIRSPMPNVIRDRSSGVIIGRNDFQGHSESVSIPYADRASHVNVFGKTNMGKSTMMHAMLHQDIANGKGIGIIDPHGNLANDVLAMSIPRNREQDVVLFDINDIEYPVGINLLRAPPNIPRETITSQVISVIRKVFADNWSGTRMEDTLYAAVHTLLHADNPDLLDVHRLLFDSSYRAQLLSNISDPITLEFWFDEFEPSSVTMQREVAKPISLRIRKFYRNEKIRNVIAQSRSLDFRQIIDSKKIFIANLSGLSDIETEVLGALLISKIQVAAMSRGASGLENVTDFYLYIDEVQSFVTTSLPTAYSESSKYGLRLVTANQYMGQLQGKTLEAIMGNVGSTIIFRVGLKDATALAPFFQPQFSNRNLVNLNRFSCVVKMQYLGETLPAFSMETLPPIAGPPDAQERVARIRELSRSKYARHRNDVNAELQLRYEQYRVRAGSLSATRDNENGDYFG